jgi:O-antigen ligase
MFAKRGLVGLGGLLLFYGVPLALLWPTRQRVLRPDGLLDRQALCLRLVGVLLPLGYLGFGLTQVFLAHFNGNMVYLFMVLLTLAALQVTEGQAPLR